MKDTDTVIELLLYRGFRFTVFTSLILYHFICFYSSVSLLAFRLPFLINLLSQQLEGQIQVI